MICNDVYGNWSHDQIKYFDWLKSGIQDRVLKQLGHSSDFWTLNLHTSDLGGGDSVTETVTIIDQVIHIHVHLVTNKHVVKGMEDYVHVYLK